MIERFREIDIPESVSVSVEALSILGLKIAKDKSLLAEVLHNDYTQFTEGQPRTGELFVHLPLENDHQMRTMLDKVDNHVYKDGYNYPKFAVWHKTHWTHGAKDISHLLMGIGRHKKANADISDLSGQSRLALCDDSNPMFPFVHFVDMPFDKENLTKKDEGKDRVTQHDAYKEQRDKFEVENPDFDMFTLDVASFAMLTLQRRIKGERTPSPFGTMIIPDLGRKAITGGSAVSIVHISANGQIGMGWSRGDRSFGTGIGISIGRNK